jgi:hypothetical protein
VLSVPIANFDTIRRLRNDPGLLIIHNDMGHACFSVHWQTAFILSSHEL